MIDDNPWMPWGRKTREEIVEEACEQLKRDLDELRAQTQSGRDDRQEG
jgi:hypothetical protein